MSGNVVPSSGDINFNSNASLTAVRQVFGTGSNMLALINSPVDTVATRPPPFVAPFVPAAPLSLSYFRGKALFITPAPSDLRVTNFTTSTIRLQWSLNNVNSTSVRIAVGTSAGTINTLNWTTAVGGSDVNGTFSVNVPYYVSIYGSNGNGTASLAVSNANLFIIPAAPTFSSASISGDTITTVASSATSGAVITYTINPSDGVNFVSPGVFGDLTFGVTYTVTAIATMSNAGAAYSSNTTNSSTFTRVTPVKGGTVTKVSGRVFHTFTAASDSIIFPTSFTPSGGIEVFAVGGGGGGGGSQTTMSCAGGGGAGNILIATASSLSGTYSINCGAGGSGGLGSSASGTSASFGSATTFSTLLTAPGGGAGAGTNFAATNGGSGGGGSSGSTAARPPGSGAVGSTILTLTFTASASGGTGYFGGATLSSTNAGGGGGGAQAGGAGAGIGGNGTTSGGGTGGTGYLYYGSYYGGGGGGSAYRTSGGVGAGGIGGGGAAGGTGTAGLPNTGGGGGGGGGNGRGGNGGSGIMIISYVYP